MVMPDDLRREGDEVPAELVMPDDLRREGDEAPPEDDPCCLGDSGLVGMAPV